MLELPSIGFLNDWSASSMNKKQVLGIYCYNLAQQRKHVIKIFYNSLFPSHSHLKFCECSFCVMHITKRGISSAFQIWYQISDMFSGFPRNCTRMTGPLQFPLFSIGEKAEAYHSKMAARLTYIPRPNAASSVMISMVQLPRLPIASPKSCFIAVPRW